MRELHTNDFLFFSQVFGLFPKFVVELFNFIVEIHKNILCF